MTTSLQVARTPTFPDELRVSRSLRAPELGPRILFLSGGSALRPLCRVLKQYTHNSVHLITAFDSGGSSAQLRRAFAMPAIGDLRNRIVALADESVRGNPQIYRLFAHRLPLHAVGFELDRELQELVSGNAELVAAIPEPMRRIVQTHLRLFAEHMPEDFDLRGANLGNLLLAGGFLSHSRDLDSVLFLFSKLLEVRGVVRPIVEADLHLCAELADGTRLIGQHRLTGKEVAPIASAISELYLVDSLHAARRATTTIGERARRSIETADLICYPMGSFYSSVVANLLPRGVGRAIVRARGPRVYIPNTGHDPEQYGMSVADTLEALARYVRDDVGQDVPLGRIVNLVLLDRDPSHYSMRVDIDRLERMGAQVARLELVTENSRPHAHPQQLTQALLSLT
jgi:CofD-related protein of GAK system